MMLLEVQMYARENYNFLMYTLNAGKPVPFLHTVLGDQNPMARSNDLNIVSCTCIKTVVFSLFPVASMDYEPLSTLLMFDTCDTRQYTNITIKNDAVLENTKSFSKSAENS